MLLGRLGRRIPRVLHDFVFSDWEYFVRAQRFHYFHTRLYVVSPAKMRKSDTTKEGHRSGIDVCLPIFYFHVVHFYVFKPPSLCI
jgi:hypothetical protein